LLVFNRYVKAGSIDSIDQGNHYSLLALIEKLFSINKQLGYAASSAGLNPAELFPKWNG